MKEHILKSEEIENLKNKKLYLFDMDGTIYNENSLFEGVKTLLNNIKNINGDFVFLTNNSSKSVEDYIEKLSNLGIPTTEKNFFTSTQATILYIKNNLNYKNELIYAMGTKAFITELKKEGLNITNNITEDIKIVLVGFDTELNYQKLIDVSYLLSKDVIYIATNPDLVCPVSFGFIPDCGSICNMLFNATKREPIYIGKPNAEMINTVLDKFECSKEEAIIVGDRLYTDISSGINADVDTVCVLTGETTVEDIDETEFKPKYILDSVKNLLDIFK